MNEDQNNITNGSQPSRYFSPEYLPNDIPQNAQPYMNNMPQGPQSYNSYELPPDPQMSLLSNGRPVKKQNNRTKVLIAVLAFFVIVTTLVTIAALYLKSKAEEIIAAQEAMEARRAAREEEEEEDETPEDPPENVNPKPTGPNPTDPGDGGTTASDGEGKVLNIYCWNEELKDRMEDHYPAYQNGAIGDVEVVWTIIPSYDHSYEDAVDMALLQQSAASADEKLDIFLIEADSAQKYVNAGYAMSLADLGIDPSEVSDQYEYTREIVTDNDGVLRGAAWIACPGGLIYNREIATEVLGSDDPETVQAAVEDWDSFLATASLMKAKGYLMTAAFDDCYRVYANSRTSAWVTDGKITVDPVLKDWAEDTKTMFDAGETAYEYSWSEAWFQGFYKTGGVFCYFGPEWFIDYCMQTYDSDAVAADGGWGLCKGPQAFYWGGTWILVAEGTDNPTLAAEIIRTMTCDDAVMRDITINDMDMVNNRSVNMAFAKDPNMGNAILGGQNPYSILNGNGNAIRLYPTVYDAYCDQTFRQYMLEYITGAVSYREALDAFYTDVTGKYPELTY